MTEDDEDLGDTDIGRMLRKAMQLTNAATAQLDKLKDPPPGDDPEPRPWKYPLRQLALLRLAIGEFEAKLAAEHPEIYD